MPADASTPINRRAFLSGVTSDTAHISSLVVRAHPDRLAAIVRKISALRAAEVAMTDRSGKIVVTLETADEGGVVSAIDAITRMSGVVNVSLSYHHIDS